MRDALSSLDQLISFKGDKVTEEDALGVFGLVSRSELENLAGAILSGDVAAILSSIERFDSAGKNMRRVAGELLLHFRNLVILQALGPNAKSLVATPDQVKTLIRQAQGMDAGRIFRICDQLADMEDKLGHVLSVRTLIEMSLIRASRIATTATIEELMRAVKALKDSGAGNVQVASAPVAPPAPAAQPAPPVAQPWPVEPPAPVATPKPPPAVTPESIIPPATPASAPASDAADAARQKLLDDPRLNEIISSVPGATIANIKEKRK